MCLGDEHVHGRGDSVRLSRSLRLQVPRQSTRLQPVVRRLSRVRAFADFFFLFWQKHDFLQLDPRRHRQREPDRSAHEGDEVSHDGDRRRSLRPPTTRCPIDRRGAANNYSGFGGKFKSFHNFRRVSWTAAVRCASRRFIFSATTFKASRTWSKCTPRRS